MLPDAVTWDLCHPQFAAEDGGKSNQAGAIICDWNSIPILYNNSSNRSIIS